MTSQPANRTAPPASNLLFAALALGLSVLALWPSAALAEECPNAAFRTGPSTHLPDCRAYELVSPSYKATGAIEGFSVSPGGSTAVMELFAAIEGAESLNGLIRPGPYSLQRTASGWATVADALPSSEYIDYLYGEAEAYEGLSLNGETTVFAERQTGEAENRIDFFERLADHSIVHVGPGLPPSAPSGELHEIGHAHDLSAVGMSADGSRLLFALAGEFWPGDETEARPTPEGSPHSLYEYLGSGNTTPLLVGVDSAGRQISDCGTVLGAGDPSSGAGYGLIGSSHNAISTNGNTVFFTAYPDEYQGDRCKAAAPPVAELFARVDNGLPSAHTVAISQPSEADCSACYTNGVLNSAGALADAQFAGASEDGSKVLFTTAQPLLGSDTTGNLYEYDFDAPPGERLVRVSTAQVTRVQNVAPLVSEDGSHVYFVAEGLLTETPNGVGEAAETGALNLYMYERDAHYPTGRLAFVARLGAHDPATGSVTPDGHFLVFTSERDLTPDDTSKEAEQVFEYDAQSGALMRVSIGQHGFNHDGNVEGGRDSAQIAAAPFDFLYESSGYSSRLSVSADGSRVFFESPVGLTPQALNEQGNAGQGFFENVYEYHDGQVSLISDGQDTSGTVKLLTTDESGDDVFFYTVDRLVGQDSDTNLDVYDARIDGGFPPPAAPASCAGEACQGALSGAPTLLSPGSEFQQGGNPPLASPSAAPAKQQKKRKPAVKKSRKRHAKRHGRASKAGRRARAGGRS